MKIIDISNCNEDVISYINKLQDKYAELEKLNKELNKSNIVISRENEYLYKKIENAIEFLKENACIDEDEEYFCDDLRYDDCKTLLEI